MNHKLEVVFVQGTSFISKTISKVSKRLNKDEYKGNFYPSHVLLVLDEKVIFESSTYKRDDTKKKAYEKGTRVLLLEDIDNRVEDSIINRCIISEDCDPYLALKYVARASNYHYSYGSIIKFLAKGHLHTQNTNKKKSEYICSGLVLDALREPVFKTNKAIQLVVNKFKGIDSNTVTPLDLYNAMLEAGFNFSSSRGFKFDNNI